MSATDDKKLSLIPTPSSALARTASQALATRGLRDLDLAAQIDCVFVVDDEPSVRETISSMLESAGYTCRGFTNGVEVLALLESGEKCDLLITDLLNSPMDGLTLLQRMKEQFPKVVVIVASVLVLDRDLLQDCINSGAFLFLQEPFERDQLLHAARYALTHGRK